MINNYIFFTNMSLHKETKSIIEYIIVKNIKNKAKYDFILKNIIYDKVNNSVKTYKNIVTEFGIYKAIKSYEKTYDKFIIDDEEDVNNRKLANYLITNWFKKNYSFEIYETEVYEYYENDIKREKTRKIFGIYDNDNIYMSLICRGCKTDFAWIKDDEYGLYCESCNNKKRLETDVEKY